MGMRFSMATATGKARVYEANNYHSTLVNLIYWAIQPLYAINREYLCHYPHL